MTRWTGNEISVVGKNIHEMRYNVYEHNDIFDQYISTLSCMHFTTSISNITNITRKPKGSILTSSPQLLTKEARSENLAVFLHVVCVVVFDIRHSSMSR